MTHISIQPGKLFNQTDVDYSTTGFSEIYDILLATDPVHFFNKSMKLCDKNTTADVVNRHISSSDNDSDIMEY